MFIGIDDTDSERGLCTTYLAAVLMERLQPLGEVVGLPRLIRLNPCARYKTRGNAALAFCLESSQPDKVKRVALKTLLELSDFSGANTNPGLVIADNVSERMRSFYRSAVREILQIEDARSLLDEEGIWHRGFKKGRGLIGALAAAGADLPDFTYELIAYRERKRWGTPRFIDPSSVWQADNLTYPATWDTVDHDNRRIVFAPHSGDPVLFGIRGSNPDAIYRAFQTIKSEPVERSVLYLTNQGTDAHILAGNISEVEDSQSYRLRGFVAERPRAIEGGHVFLTLQNGRDKRAGTGAGSAEGTGSSDSSGRAEGAGGAHSIECAAFEPTKNFRSIIKKLLPGDELEVYGSVRDGALNLERINILQLTPQVETKPPLCPQCSRRMESAGRGQGHRCRRCKTRSSSLERIELPRDLETGFYEVPPCARRHLSKPLVRLKNSGLDVHPSR